MLRILSLSYRIWQSLPESLGRLILRYSLSEPSCLSVRNGSHIERPQASVLEKAPAGLSANSQHPSPAM